MAWHVLGLVFVLGYLRCDLAVEDINSSMLLWLPFSSWCHPSLQGDRIPLISPLQAINGPSEIPELEDLIGNSAEALVTASMDRWLEALDCIILMRSLPHKISRFILVYWRERWNRSLEHCWKKTQNDSDWTCVGAHVRDYLIYKGETAKLLFLSCISF